MVKRLFLTSSIGTPGVAESIRQKLGGKQPLKTAFITTPVEPKSEQEDLEWYHADRLALKGGGFDLFDYTVTGKSPTKLVNDLDNIQALFISGGSTAHLLEQSQKSGFVDFIKDYITSGRPYIGCSAGSIIAGPQLPEYLRDEGRGGKDIINYSSYELVNFTVVPHWGDPVFSKIYLNERLNQVSDENHQPFIFLNNHQYVEVRDDWYRVVDVR